MSLDFRVAALPYIHCCHRLTGFSGRFRSLTNPVRWCNSSSFATPLKRGHYGCWALCYMILLPPRAAIHNLQRPKAAVKPKNPPARKGRSILRTFLYNPSAQPAAIHNPLRPRGASFYTPGREGPYVPYFLPIIPYRQDITLCYCIDFSIRWNYNISIDLSIIYG